MSNPTDPADRVFELAGAICDGLVSESEVAELDSMVVANETARSCYWGYCWIHTSLKMESRIQRAMRAVQERDKLDPASLVPWELDALAADIQPPSVADFPVFAPPAPLRAPFAWFSNGLPTAYTAYLVATIITGLGLWLASLVYVAYPGQTARSGSPAVAASSGAATQVVGAITNMVDCRWDQERSSIADRTDVSVGCKYALASGLMEITYRTGARVILQGPVRYEVESRNGGFLSIGRLTGKVEAATAKGFAVRTPTAIVTDLGTEFGVEVDAKNVTHTQVFAGKVQVQEVSDSSDAAGSPVTLTAGQCAQIGKDRGVSLAGGKAEFEQNARRFIREIPATTNRGDAYAEIVLSMRPVAYYRMEPPADPTRQSILFDSSPGANHGLLRFSDRYVGKPYASGPIGHSLRLRGSMTADCAASPGCPPATGDRLTVSIWACLAARSAENRAMMVMQHGLHAPSPEAAMCPFTLCVYGTTGFLEAWTTDRNGRGWATAVEQKQFPVGVWQHVAFVVDGASLRLYRNGIEVAVAPCNGLLPCPTPPCLRIGCLGGDDGVRPSTSPYYWSGRLDELAIFHRALSPAEIQKLYDGPTSSPVSGSRLTEKVQFR